MSSCSNKETSVSFKRPSAKEPSDRREKLVSSAVGALQLLKLTANLISRQDLPTQESPMMSSCKEEDYLQGKGQAALSQYTASRALSDGAVHVPP